MKKRRVAVLYGGNSVEHEISVITALQAMQAMDPYRYEIIPVYLTKNGKWVTGDALFEKGFYQTLPYASVEEITLEPNPNVGGFLKNGKVIPVDTCFLAFHGKYGEDGSVQGLLELAGIPYTGCGVMASALTMNKFLTKCVLESQDIAVLPSVLATRTEARKDLAALRQKILDQFQFPLFVKPNQLGSSIGISAAKDETSLNAALANVFQYDETALVEPQITDLMELNVAVLDGDPPEASLVEIPFASDGILTYEDKYKRNGAKSSGGLSDGMAGLTRVIDPSGLDPAMKRQLQELAVKIFQILGCSGVCRLDFMYDQSKDCVYFNELNAIPGSMAYYLWEGKYLYSELIDRVLEMSRV